MFQLRSAVEELRTLADQAQHPRVKDILTLDLRKLETELTLLKSQEDEQQVVSPTTSTQSGPRVYTVKLTNYGMYLLYSTVRAMP
jgi:hypothetical protein